MTENYKKKQKMHRKKFLLNEIRQILSLKSSCRTRIVPKKSGAKVGSLMCFRGCGCSLKKKNTVTALVGHFSLNGKAPTKNKPGTAQVDALL